MNHCGLFWKVSTRDGWKWVRCMHNKQPHPSKHESGLHSIEVGKEESVADHYWQMEGDLV